MFITELKRHFPARFPEWMNAGIMASWGFYALSHPTIFTEQPTAALLEGLRAWTWNGYHPATVWGLVTLLVGMVRGFALFVNGAYNRTPLIRLITSAISAFVWSQLIIGLWKTGIPNVNIVVYTWLLVIDVASAYRAGLDAAIAEQSRKAAKESSRARYNATAHGHGL